ncbi:HipA domain-containing protein [Hymenobacter antarcticus]|uniref:HipA domain-containing protein n=1 Tax=Hymenobacter antarcticus TaxID=486270 RepID=A0ABP7QME9_9BACT
MSYCASCLRKLRKTDGDFCPPCRTELFDGAPVSNRLTFASPAQATMAEVENFQRLTRQISISGVQEKFSLARSADEPGRLELVVRGGTYLLKPVPPANFGAVQSVPANEHFTMQLARQVFKLPTAACALLQMADGSPAYLTRRFDVRPDGLRLAQEDFAQLSQRTEQEHGPNYKYDFSYEEIGVLLKKYLPTHYLPEATLFFRLTLFNYLVSNGDAHLKNYSLHRRPETGEYHLTPAYDLLNTALHVSDGNGLALDLFADGYETASFAANGFLAYDDFLELGIRIGLPPSRVRRLLADIVSHEPAIENLLEKSLLPAELREQYANTLASRRQRLRYSLAGAK